MPLHEKIASISKKTCQLLGDSVRSPPEADNFRPPDPQPKSQTLWIRTPAPTHTEWSSYGPARIIGTLPIILLLYQTINSIFWSLKPLNYRIINGNDNAMQGQNDKATYKNITLFELNKSTTTYLTKGQPRPL